ncbi:MAG: adenylate/guanylate cyclase domain-containing protein [Gemmataceae bacterium]|nr:adenylate/guanylate cyclase domain-containing protein [Gemmataceae bacterium]
MKHSLRVTLLTVLLGLTILTASLLGIVAYLDARDTATDLTRQILHETSKRIEHRVDDLVRIARRQVLLNERLLQEGFLEEDSPARLIEYWEQVLNEYHSLNALYLTRASDGTSIVIAKVPEVGMRVEFLQPQGNGRFTVYLATVEEAKRGQKGVLLREGTAKEIDPRLESWYRDARKAQTAVWVDTDRNIDDKRTRSMASATHACPLRGPKNREYVLGLDFYLFSLCDYLRGIQVGDNGLAFIVERQSDGRRRVIAHPRADVVIPPGHNRLVPIEELSDSRLRAFLARVPDEMHGSEELRQFEDDGIRYFGVYHSPRNPDGTPPDWFIGMILPEKDVLARAERNGRRSFLIAGLVVLIAIALSLFVARQVSRPVEQMARDVAAIGRLNLDAHPHPQSIILEVDQLQRALEDMKTSLRSFRKYVPADLVALLMASGQEAALGGERRPLTIYFSDIANFTTISESMDPEQLVDHLGEYLHVLSDQILATGGTVDKYIGDAIMAFWGEPVALPDHALAACTAAVRNQELLLELRERWAREGKPPFHARIGINTGEAVVGNIGSAKRFNYTVIGDAVNLASRLEGLNKYYATQILISQATYEEAKAAIVARPLDKVSVKGKNTAVLVYELLGLKGETPPEQEEMAEKFAQALHAYLRQEWTAALCGFEALLERRPEDAPAREMKRRCEAYRERAPGVGWDGVHHMENK